jgi:translation initiation factor 2 alpha subunit (eIF-2alpha)
MNENSFVMERLYKPEFPSVDDIVVVQITKLDESGAKCKLLEYGNMDGFVPISQFSKRGRIRSIKQIFQVGSIYPLHVINVEPVKGVVDLSKKHITADESEECLHRYKEAKIADGILRRTAEICSVPKIVIYQQCIWPLCFKVETIRLHNTKESRLSNDEGLNDENNEGSNDENNEGSNDENNEGLNDEKNEELNDENNEESESEDEKEHISSLEVLHCLFRKPSMIEMYSLDSSIKTALIDILQTKLKPTIKKMYSTVTITCFGQGGVNSIKSILKSGLEYGNIIKSEFITDNDNEYNIKMYTVGCPDYELSIETRDIEKGKLFLTRVIDKMHTEMKSISGGCITVKSKPNIIS